MAYRILSIALFGLFASACVDQPGAVVCPTGIVCPDGATCAAAQPVCIVTSCGNGRVDTGEACDDGNILSGDGCSPNCGSESCGNGAVEPGERCDDGNTANGDGCSADCLSLETCGNSIVDVKKGGDDAERCDDGNTAAGDGCRADCKEREFCNSGFLDPGEVCDDGDPIGGPCSPDCQSGLGCGNGFLDPGEECDDGNDIDTDDCRFPSCKHAVCGDGVENAEGIRFEECDGGSTGVPTETADCNIDCTDRACGDGKVNQAASEECDNGTMNDSATCDSDCTIPVCGDGHVNATVTPTEECDPGAIGVDTAACDSDCTTPQCGDNHINKTFTPAGGDVPEGCDDGGTTAGDGCSSVCRIESCGNGVVEMVNGEACDDGNAVDTDACRNNCQNPSCGDGVKSDSEPCDTGADSQTCNINCTVPMCGDGRVNAAFTPTGAPGPEQCDDGGTTNGDGCSSTCQLEPFALSVSVVGNGTGNVASNPTGINCGTGGSQCGAVYPAGTMVTLTATPSANATFNGWSGACNGTGPCVVTMSQARSVTATFAANRLTVTKSGTGTGTVTGGGINCGATCTNDYNVGTMVTLTATPSGDSVFAGWTGACSNAVGDCTITMNQATSVNAIFTLTQFTLSVAKNGNGSGHLGSVPTGIDCGATCMANFTANTVVTLVPTPAEDSQFASWSGACMGSSTCSVTMTQARSVTATFNKKPVRLTVSVSGNGDVSSVPAGIDCGNDCTQDYAFNTMVTLSPDPDNDHAFIGWGGACNGTGACVVTMDAAKNVTATFQRNRLTVTRTGTGSGNVSSSPNGINCGFDCTGDYNQGTSVTLTANAANGDIFTGWDHPSCPGTGTCSITMNGPVTVSANFDDAATLTVTPPTNGTIAGGTASNNMLINCPGDCTETISEGTMMTLTATPAAGFVVGSWTGCNSTNGATCNVTLSTNKTVSVTFIAQFALNLTVSGTGTVDSNPAGITACTMAGGDCTETYNDGTVVTLTATGGTPSWTGSCNSCASATSCMVTMDAAKSCTATFP